MESDIGSRDEMLGLTDNDVWPTDERPDLTLQFGDDDE